MEMKKVFITVTPHYELEEGSVFDSVEQAAKAIKQEAKDVIYQHEHDVYGTRKKYIEDSYPMTTLVSFEEWDKFQDAKDEEGNQFSVFKRVVRRKLSLEKF